VSGYGVLTRLFGPDVEGVAAGVTGEVAVVAVVDAVVVVGVTR
jgi:hypothetical protein